jgi:hypothetical protein
VGVRLSMNDDDTLLPFNQRLRNFRWSAKAASDHASTVRRLCAHCRRRRLSQRATDLPWNLPFANAAEKVSDGDSRRSRHPFGAEAISTISARRQNCIQGSGTGAADPDLPAMKTCNWASQFTFGRGLLHASVSSAANSLRRVSSALDGFSG